MFYVTYDILVYSFFNINIKFLLHGVVILYKRLEIYNKTKNKRSLQDRFVVCFHTYWAHTVPMANSIENGKKCYMGNKISLKLY